MLLIVNVNVLQNDIMLEVFITLIFTKPETKIEI